MSREYVQAKDYRLAGAGVAATDTSITIVSMTLPNSNALVTMADFGSEIGFMTIEPETNREENISFTGITQNVNGTATLTGVVRGLTFVSPSTVDVNLRQSHSGGSIIRVTNSTQFYENIANKYNTGTIKATWTFNADADNANPKIDDTSYVPVDDDYITKFYADNTYGVSPLTTKGDLYTYDTGNARLPVGTDGQILSADSAETTGLKWIDVLAGGGGGGTKLAIDTTEVTVGNTTVETTLFTVVIPGGTLSTNNAIRFNTIIRSTGMVNTNGETLTLRVKYGGTTVSSVVINDPETQFTGIGGNFSGCIVADGATDAQKAAAQLVLTDNYGETLADTTVGITKMQGFGYGTGAEVSTGNLNLVLTAQWSAANAVNTITAEAIVVEKISSEGGGVLIDLTAEEDLTAGDTVGFASHIDDAAFKAVWAERLASANIGINNSAVHAVCRLTDDVYAILIVRVGGSGPYGTIIGTLDRDTQTWSFGAPSASIGINSSIGSPDIVTLDTDKFAVTAFTSVTNPYTIEVVVCTVSGTTITVGNSDSFSEPSTDNANNVMCVQLATDRFAMVVGGTQAGSHCDLFEVTVSGNTPTIGTQEILDNSTQRISGIEVIDTDKVAVVNDTNIWIATVSGGTWTVGSPVTMSTSTGTVVGRFGIKSAATDTVYVATLTSNVTIEYFTVSGTVPTSVDTLNSLSTSSTSMTLVSDQTDVFLISQTVTAGENGASKLSILGGTTIVSSPFIPFDISDNPSTNTMFANQVLEGSDYFGICQSNNNATGNLLEFIYHVQGMTPYFIGIAQATTARGASVNVLITGVDSNQTGLTPGALYNAFEGGIVNTATQTFDTLKAQSATDIKV